MIYIRLHFFIIHLFICQTKKNIKIINKLLMLVLNCLICKEKEKKVGLLIYIKSAKQLYIFILLVLFLFFYLYFLYVHYIQSQNHNYYGFQAIEKFEIDKYMYTLV